jgi:Long-chain fatty aldehyde decarbonylase
MTATAFDQLVISQAITGELIAIENYARMIPYAVTADEKLALLEEAMHERSHIKSLRNVAKMLGLSDVDGTANDPYWSKVRTQMVSALEGGQLAHARFIQDFILEAYAITLYAAVLPRLCTVFAPKIRVILADEQTHLESAIAWARALYLADPEQVHAIVEATNLRVAAVLASWVAPDDCKPICGACRKLSGSCGKPELARGGVSTGVLAGAFMDTYGKALREVGFPAFAVAQWLAELVAI